MTVYDSTGVVTALEINLVLNVKVHDTHDAVGGQKARERINNRVELGNHGETVAHGQEVGADPGDGMVAQRGTANAEDGLFVTNAGLVVAEAEHARILAHDLDVGPTEPGEALLGHLAQRGRQIDQVDGMEEVGDGQVLLHLLNVPAGAAANVNPDGLALQLVLLDLVL